MFARSRRPRGSFLRMIALFLPITLLLLSAAAFGAADAAASAAAPTGSPEFSMETDLGTSSKGDVMIVSLYCDNQSSATLTSFQGILEYDSTLFSFVKAEKSRNFVVYPNNQTITVDTKGASSDNIGFTFSDTANTLLTPDSGSELGYFLRLYFNIIARESTTTTFKCSIIDCYSGTEEDGTLYKFCSSSDPIEFSSHRVFVAGKTTTTESTSTTSTTEPSTTATTAPANLSGENRLRLLTVSQGTMMPIFSPEVVAYSVDVDYSCSTIRISAEPYDNTVKAVEGYGVKDLKVGSNSFFINVTAQNGSVRTYGVIVTRAPEVNSVNVLVDVSDTDASVLQPVTEVETTTTFDFTTVPSVTEESMAVVVPDNPGASDAATKVMGIILGLIALFFFGFLSGFFIDKKLKRRDLEELPLDGLVRAVQGGYMMPGQPLPAPGPYMDDPNMLYGPEAYPEDQYEEEYPVVDPYAVSHYDELGGLAALTNAAYPDSDDEEDYYGQ